MGTIAIQLDFPGATLEQYDAVIERMGLEAGGAAPQGALFHWVAETDEGLRIVDVWETREAFDEFAELQIGPITQEIGFPGQPEMTYFDVHNHMTVADAAKVANVA